jgi:hypothetical protein
MNPIAPCKAYVDRLRGAGQDAQLTEYPGDTVGNASGRHESGVARELLPDGGFI